MKRVAFHSQYVQELPSSHRFPMEKYDLLPRQLLHEGTLHQEDFFEPDPIDLNYVYCVHQQDYVDRLIQLKLSKSEQRRTGFEHNEDLITRELRIMEGTRVCALSAFANRSITFNVAGGTHHAFSNRGEGFCLLNDQAIAAAFLLAEENVQKVLILDLDVHQGNGTAEIFSTNPNVFTFSMHGKHNYPLHKEKSDLDVELEDGVGDKAYLEALRINLDLVLNSFEPQLVFYLCGADVLETDKLGRLNLTRKGCSERDKLVFSTIKRLGVPTVCSMGGGYSPDIMDIVETHSNTFRLGLEFFD